MTNNAVFQKHSLKWKFIIIIVLLFIILNTSGSYAQPTLPIPRIGLTIEEAENPQEAATSIQILFLLTVLSIAPAILIMMTSFTRIIIVLSFLRNAIATQQTPPTQVIIGLALFLTFFTMRPIAAEINQNALQPYLQEEITQTEAIENAMKPVREFMFRQVREKDLALFVDISKLEIPENASLDSTDFRDRIPNTVLIPSFIISELKTAFQLGFILFIPFIVIDMVVASTLMSMGMMMLPPAMISLPFKLLLFIMIDGWNILTRSLLLSFK